MKQQKLNNPPPNLANVPHVVNIHRSDNNIGLVATATAVTYSYGPAFANYLYLLP